MYLAKTKWNFEPYNATSYKGWVVGRGASDNKGSIAVMFTLFKIFKALGIKLNYNPAMYVGSNEETGMADMIGKDGNADAKGFLNVFLPPKMSLVPDGGKFPVGYGGKGGLTVCLRSKKPLRDLTVIAGKKESPGTATAIYDESLSISGDFEGCSVTRGKTIEISAYSHPRHTSNPDPNGNMITVLMNALLMADGICKNDVEILAFLKKLSLDVYGEFLNINTQNEIMGPLTACSYEIENFQNCPELKLRIRYPVGISCEDIIKRISTVAEENDFYVSDYTAGVEPYLLDKNLEVIQRLTAVANEVTGDCAAPFVMSGGTYAHRLPNALVYGIDGCRPPEEFPEGVGCAHGTDEAVSIKYLKRAMRIYARALLELQEADWRSND